MNILQVNAFFGQINELPVPEGVEPPIAVNLDPFRGVNDGIVPTFLEEPLADAIKNGKDVIRGGNTHHITGVQISRGIQYHALLAQIETLTVINQSVNEGELVVNISHCGNLGNFAMRFLIGMPHVKVNFHGFNPKWAKSLHALLPFSRRVKYLDPKVVDEILPLEDQDDSVHLPKPSAAFTAVKTVDVGTDIDDEEEEADIAPPAKRAARKKVAVVKAADDEDEADIVPLAKKKAPAKKTATKKAVTKKSEIEVVTEEPAKKKAPAKKTAVKKVAASDEALSELATKFPKKK